MHSRSSRVAQVFSRPTMATGISCARRVAAASGSMAMPACWATSWAMASKLGARTRTFSGKA